MLIISSPSPFQAAADLTKTPYRDAWFTLTFKLDPQIIHKAISVYESLGAQLKGLVPDGDFCLFLVLQPLPATFGQHSAARGGNMFGLDRFSDDDCVLMVGVVEVATPELLATVGAPAMRGAVAEIDAYAASVGGGVAFRYPNYADGSQHPLATFGAENIRKMKEAAAKYDPAQVFQTRVPGGFKISQVK